ncbi:MAG: PIN domain-containing protein [Verrucomicrobiae bacterium]|nr:PIN domain-containing protein [Verrucomicrobiae bacterium]
MNGLFVDTAGWMACADEDDPSHKQMMASRDAWLEDGGLLVTTDYVADETLTLLRVRLGLAAAKNWWRQVENSMRLRWELITVERSIKARDMFFQYDDHDFSFTDCASFVVMRELRLKRALTTDRHFIHAGFQIH